jgi:hypothetical protein
MIRLPTIGAAGFTDATSNVGEFSAVCAKAAQEVKTTKPALMIARSICRIPLHFNVIYDELARGMFRR